MGLLGLNGVLWVQFGLLRFNMACRGSLGVKWSSMGSMWFAGFLGVKWGSMGFNGVLCGSWGFL